MQFVPIGGICDRGFFACNDQPQNTQNNWVFTQLINTLSAREIFFNVTVNDCFQEPCSDFLSLHVSNSVTESSSRTDVTKYERLTDISNQLSSKTILSSTQRESSSIYFGIQDTGFCGITGRVLIYYRVCLGRQTGLVVYPEKALPPRNKPVEYFEASCVENAHNITSLRVRASGADGTCNDVASSGARCECNLGYFNQNGVCKGKLLYIIVNEFWYHLNFCFISSACQPGTYGSGGQCLNCPQSSSSTVSGATICECFPGSYRSSQETASQACTGKYLGHLKS